MRLLFQRKILKLQERQQSFQMRGEVQTIAIDKDIIVNAGGTGSADEKSENAGFTDNRGFPDSTEHGRLHFPE